MQPLINPWHGYIDRCIIRPGCRSHGKFVHVHVFVKHWSLDSMIWLFCLIGDLLLCFTDYSLHISAFSHLSATSHPVIQSYWYSFLPILLSKFLVLKSINFRFFCSLLVYTAANVLNKTSVRLQVIHLSLTLLCPWLTTPLALCSGILHSNLKTFITLQRSYPYFLHLPFNSHEWDWTFRALGSLDCISLTYKVVYLFI